MTPIQDKSASIYTSRGGNEVTKSSNLLAIDDNKLIANSDTTPVDYLQNIRLNSGDALLFNTNLIHGVTVDNNHDFTGNTFTVMSFTLRLSSIKITGCHSLNMNYRWLRKK